MQNIDPIELTLMADQNRQELTKVVWKLWKLINVFACVAAVGNAKAKVEVEILEKAPLEVMPLNHTKAVNWPVTHCELHTVNRNKKDKIYD